MREMKTELRKMWNITENINAAKYLILLDALKLFRLRVSRNGKKLVKNDLLK